MVALKAVKCSAMCMLQFGVVPKSLLRNCTELHVGETLRLKLRVFQRRMEANTLQ